MAGTQSGFQDAAAKAAQPVVTSCLAPVIAYCIASSLVMLTLVAAVRVQQASATMLLVIAVPVFLVPLFVPRAADTTRSLMVCVLGWLLATALLACLAWFVLGVPPAPERLWRAGLLALGILVVTHQAVTLLEAALRGMAVDGGTAHACSAWTVAALLWLAGSTPLWLGPVADLGAHVEPRIPTIVLACSPLAHLATAAGHDLLRGQWFYAHSSLGSLQVEYPGVGSLLAAYALAAAVLTLLLVSVRRWSHPAAAGAPSISPLEHYS